MNPTGPVTIQRRVPPTAVPAPASLRAWAHVALEGTRGETTIRIVDEAESAALNERFRNKPQPTNVLSFTYDGEALAIPILGDLVICAPVVRREAVEQHKQARAHWAHMVVHGILHLRGFDHERENDAEVMEQREREILARLGFDDPYSERDVAGCPGRQAQA